jgi:hypothetical protein
MNPPDCW